MTDALAAVLPRVAERVPRVRLGDWPTPIDSLAGLGRADLFTKREDLSAQAYGGNKVRPLETMLAWYVHRGAERVYATGAWGSNQALATAVHARRVGLDAGALLFPQPASPSAALNLRALLSVGADVQLLPTIALFPAAAARAALLGRLRSGRDVVMAPGAATPRGAIGHLTAALEVALAVHEGRLPAPRHVVLPVGSTCTSAGLLAGFAAAAHLGLGFTDGPPLVHAVRVTPWPVTADFRILGLAARTAALIEELGGPPSPSPAALRARLRTSSAFLGRGYGRRTPAGDEATAAFAAAGGPRLDCTYSAKAAAYLLHTMPSLEGPILFWSTKSSPPLPPTRPEAVAVAPARARRWLARGLVD
ncbi:MAG: pyridoxal-phosphate dependent enzyme [Deltaproteobacteria bacterium]|nr:pyridoxal-phosphate dependent enzyme [Deltaproteobacteria bacterium]